MYMLLARLWLDTRRYNYYNIMMMWFTIRVFAVMTLITVFLSVVSMKHNWTWSTTDIHVAFTHVCLCVCVCEGWVIRRLTEASCFCRVVMETCFSPSWPFKDTLNCVFLIPVCVLISFVSLCNFSLFQTPRWLYAALEPDPALLKRCLLGVSPG